MDPGLSTTFIFNKLYIHFQVGECLKVHLCMVRIIIKYVDTQTVQTRYQALLCVPHVLCWRVIFHFFFFYHKYTIQPDGSR